MSSTGKQSPLGVNVLGSILSNIGFNINPVAASYMGASKTNTDYVFGSIVQSTCLRLLTWAINDAYLRGLVTSSVYDNLISIGSTTIPALGNTKPSTYIIYDPSGQWTGAATTGYYIAGNLGQGQAATWIPYTMANPNNSVTQWGFVRLYALQAWNEFNWNGIPSSSPEYKEFTTSVLIAQSFIDYTNVAIHAASAAPTFLDGVYSNMNDLITADISGVSLALPAFGQDCITMGRVIDLAKISKFGLPSVLLQTITKNNALTPSLVLALISSGLSNDEITAISTDTAPGITIEQEQKIYGAYLIIFGRDLLDILIPLNCKTAGLTNLADLLDIKKIFPTSYGSLTVPVYNTTRSPTNSKTYYPIFSGGSLNSSISNATINEIIGPIIQPGTPVTNVGTTEQDQVLPTGFGSYLVDILPKNIAVAAGAFAYSMQQLKNVQYINFEKFAQVASSIELNKGLDKVNGTTVPADIPLAIQTNNIVGLGSGPNKSYTMSDFYGCMSGLPYLWNDIYTGILQAQTTKLSNIYDELFLATTWEAATMTINYSSVYNIMTQGYIAPDPSAIPPIAGQPRIDDWYYTIDFALDDPGGGYTRGTAPPPSITFSPNNCGASASVNIGTNSYNAASNNGGTYGRVTGFATKNTGSAYKYTTTSVWQPGPPSTPTTPVETVTIETPPIATLAVNANGSKSTSGVNGTPGYSVNTSGGISLSPTGWSSPMNTVVQAYITQANTEITAIKASKVATSKNLNIAYDAAGKQLMIEQRARYTGIPEVPSPDRDTKMNRYPISLIVFTDAIPSLSMNTDPHMYAQTLEAISNMNTTGGQSVVALTRESRNQARLQLIGAELDNNLPGELTLPESKTLLANGTVYAVDPGSSINGYTIPGILILDYPPGTTTSPAPDGYYNPETGIYSVTDCVTKVNEVSPIIEILSSSATGNAPVRAGARLPCDNGSPIDTGEGYTGTLSGSEYTNIVPDELKWPLTTATLTPGSYTVEEAISETIKCNCDCWVD